MLLRSIYVFAVSFPLTIAHSWVEQLRRIDLDGTMQGKPGFVRGAVSRLDPEFAGDLSMQYLLPPNGRNPELYISDHICKDTQTIGNYSERFPQLLAQPGDYIALQHQENGHVTLPQNTPQKNSSGMIYVYGTSSPAEFDTLLSIHKVWNEHGTGGDGRGRLLAVQPFDDGQCYQINDGKISTSRQRQYPKQALDPQGADLWCQSDIRLPLDVVNSYTLYWVWDWPSAPTQAFPSGQPELYTSCADIGVLQGKQDGKVTFEHGQDLNSAGIRGQLE